MTELEFADRNTGTPVSRNGLEGDPLLGSNAFIDPVGDNARGVFTPGVGVAIDAQPISVYDPHDGSRYSASKSLKRRSEKDMGKKPSWLPEDWKMELKERVSGATIGQIDRYYIDPTGKRRFRSKNEVLRFLETGSKLKRKPDSEAASMTPGSQHQKKTKAKGED